MVSFMGSFHTAKGDISGGKGIFSHNVIHSKTSCKLYIFINISVLKQNTIASHVQG